MSAERVDVDTLITAYRVDCESGDNNSTRKFGVEFFRKPDGALWVRCRFCATPTIWIPAFRDLHRVIQAIALCEDDKYPPPAKGRNQLVPFLQDLVRDPQWARIASKYRIPERQRDVVTNANGADLSGRRRTVEWTPRERADYDDSDDNDDRWIEERDRRSR